MGVTLHLTAPSLRWQEGGLHLGWRYARKPGVAGVGPAEFFALIVRPDKASESEAGGRAKSGFGEELFVGIEVRHGQHAEAEGCAGWEGNGVMCSRQEMPSHFDRRVQAPAWMLAMAMATRVRSK